MLKIIKLTSVFVVFLLSVTLFSSDWAYSDSGHKISNDELVIVRGLNANNAKDKKMLHGSDKVLLRADEARALRGRNPNIEILPVLSYRPTTNDPLEPQQYLTLLEASDVWSIGTGNSNTVVAVIDSGVALEHEDLENRWFINSGEFGATTDEGPAPNCTSRGLTLDRSCNNIDDDSNGLVDDFRGWDFAGNDNDVSAGETNSSGAGVGHGTAVSGFVGATGNNGVGVASVNWGASILPIQVFDDDGNATTVELAQGIAYALEMGADVINLSLGTTATDNVIEDLLDVAEEIGVTVVAAAGNCGGVNYAFNGCSFEGQMLYPATNPYTIAVAATDINDVQASFSSEGSTVDIAAPGTGQLRTTLYSSSSSTGVYSSSISGTSFSAPIVSGAVALVKDVWPDANAREIRAIFVDSALRVSGMNGELFTEEYGYGRIQPYEALQLAQSCLNASFSEDINCDDAVDLLDLSILASQWNVVRSGRSDINLSGRTDLLDLSLLASRWGS
jgi:subtilisin family serine protease